MPSEFSPTYILQGNTHTITTTLIKLAFEFALLSQTKIARLLITLLNIHHPLFHKTSIELKPLWLCWQATGEWPDGEREKAGTDEEIQELVKEWEESQWYKEDISGSTEDEEKLKRVWHQLGDGKRAYVEDGRGIPDEGGLVKALDLRLKIQDAGSANEGLPSLQEILRKIVGKLENLRSMWHYLAQSRLVWEFVKTGGIAEAAGIDKTKIQEFGKVMERTFKRRFEEGRQMPEVRGVQQMLIAIQENTQRNAMAKQQMLENGVPEYETDDYLHLFEDPATADAISALEDKLGARLPEAYKTFLSISNGFGPSWGGIAFDPPLFSVEDVRWIDDQGREDFMAEMQMDLLNLQVHFFISDDEYEKWPRVGRALYIGVEDTTSLWLIPPSTVSDVRDAYLALLDSDASSEEMKTEIESAIQDFCGSVEEFEKCEWCVVEWDSTDFVGWASFEGFLANKMRSSTTDEYKLVTGPISMAEEYRAGIIA